MKKKQCAYAARLRDFLNRDLTLNNWTVQVRTGFQYAFPGVEISQAQFEEWERRFTILKDQLHEVEVLYPRGYYIIFDYEVKNCGRSDVILLSNEQVLLFKFVNSDKPVAEDKEKLLKAYKEIKKKHYESRELQVKSIMVLEQSENCLEEDKDNNLLICSRRDLSSLLIRLVVTPLDKWLASKYE